MHLKRFQVHKFRRFEQLTLEDLPNTARLVVLAGPNGAGKSSLFDAFRTWQGARGARNYSYDKSYHQRGGSVVSIEHNWPDDVDIEFHELLPSSGPESQKAFYIRSAYRNDPDFTVSQLTRSSSPLETFKVPRLIDNDASVADNYQRLISAAVGDIFSGQQDASTVANLRENLIGRIRDAMLRIFRNLYLQSLGDPLENGSFYFEKGASSNFHYKNLSGGEKAAFDILLDIIVKSKTYDDTIFCIDEPEMHMNTKVQARLLEELVTIIPQNSQLWISTHAIGMMRKAREMQVNRPDEVVFLDFDQDFDQPVTLKPIKVDRAFWARTLDVALDDLAQLIAPRQVVLCEGRPAQANISYKTKPEFDAQCYRTIFATEFPDTDFISVGSEQNVRTDQVGIGQTIQTLIEGTTVIRVVDQDDRSPNEVAELQKDGVRVLSKRHLEAFLLDDEVIEKLCNVQGHPTKIPEALAAKSAAIADSVARNYPPDDVKAASGSIYVAIKN